MLMPPNQTNPYDFIMNSNQKPPRRSIFDLPTPVKIALVVGLLILIIIIWTVISSFLNSDSNAQKDRLINVAQKQGEIIRISALAEKDSAGSPAKELAINARLSAQSSQAQVKALLKSRGVGDKSATSQIAAGKNVKNDEVLQDGKDNGRYDDTFLALIDQQLTDYQKLVQSAYENGSVKEKTALQTAFNDTVLLLGEDPKPNQ